MTIQSKSPCACNSNSAVCRKNATATAAAVTTTSTTTTSITTTTNTTYLYTGHAGGTEVACAYNVVTNTVSLLEQAELGYFAMNVCDVIQTYKV